MNEILAIIALGMSIVTFTVVVVQPYYAKWKRHKWFEEFHNSPDNPFNSEEVRELMNGIEKARTSY